MSLFELKMPKLGESVTEGTIGKWLKQPGEKVEKYDLLVEVQTDKVNTEIPSPVDGTLKDVKVKEGDTVPIGALLATFETAESAAAPEGTATASPATAEAPAAPAPAAAQPGPAANSAPPAPASCGSSSAAGRAVPPWTARRGGAARRACRPAAGTPARRQRAGPMRRHQASGTPTAPARQ